MPLVNVTDIDRDRYYTDYVNTYLERDVQQLAQVGKMDQFYDFLVYMASITAQELNYSEIAKRIGITSPTAKAWVTILRASGTIFILHPYSNNISNRLVKIPKVYFMDTGLAAYLLRWPTAQTIENGAMDGAFLETYVVSEIVKSFQNNGKPADIFYYRDIDRKELDLVMVDGSSIYPIEIKKNALPTDADKNFDVLSKFKLDVQAGIVLCMTKTLVPLSRKAWLCPISAL
jgi:predicted AAA+ superfamily ATPase